MANIKEAKKAVVDAFLTAWNDQTEVALDNHPFDSERDGLTSWVRAVVRNVGGGQRTLGPVGNRKYDRDANFIVQVFTESGRGSGPADTLAQAVIDAMEGKTIDQIYLFDAVSTEIGVEGRWYQVNVTVAIRYIEVK